MKTNGFIFFCSVICFSIDILIVEGRSIKESEPGVIAKEIVNTIQRKEKTELELMARQPRQDDEDVGTGSAAANAAASNSAALISPGTPIGQIIQNIVPDAQETVVSILKAVSSPFDFISKSVDNYINPTTTPAPPPTEPPRRNSNPYGTVLSGNSDITVVLLPEAIHGLTVPVTKPKVVVPKPVTATSTSSEADEEDEEGSNSDY